MMAGLIVRCDNTCCVCGFVSIWGHHTSWPLNNLENDGNFEGYKSCDNPRYSPCLVAIQSYPPVLKHENNIYIYIFMYIHHINGGFNGKTDHLIYIIWSSRSKFHLSWAVPWKQQQLGRTLRSVPFVECHAQWWTHKQAHCGEVPRIFWG